MTAETQRLPKTTLPMADVLDPQAKTRMSYWWQRLTAPSDKLHGDDRRKAAAVASFLVVLLPLSFITIFQPTFTSLLAGDALALPAPGVLGASMLLVFAYLISRSRWYVWASYIVIAVPYLAVMVPTLSDKAALIDVTLIFLALAPLFAGLLAGWKETLISGAIAAALVIVGMNNALTVISPTVLTFVILTTGVIALVSSVRDGYIRRLETTQEQLKDQVVETEKARQKAVQSDQVKSSFLASMSHELRTPLNAIINYSKFVSNGTLGEVNAEQKEILEASTESAEHLLNLINDVLDMSKIESGALSLFLEDGIDLMPIFERVIATGNSLKADKPLDLQLDVAGELPLLHGDRQRITQILLNIMSNAVKFTETGSVRLHAQRQGDEVLLSIQDTGPGIAAADQAAVFQAFKQTKTGLRQGGGTGLGMPISKSLAEAHGGRMWLESEPGQGSTFHVALPVYAVEPMAS